jgi:hypothetical protein
VIVASGDELEILRTARRTIPYSMCRDPWPFPKTFAEATVTMLYTFQLDVWQLWRTKVGQPFYTLDGTRKLWAGSAESVRSVCEIRLEDGTDARLVPYGTEMLIVPRASLNPVAGGRVDPGLVEEAVR